MWPFKGFKAGGVIQAPEMTKHNRSSKQELVDEMRAWRKIGDTFNYLGRECVVTGYARYIPHHLGIDVAVELQADYADDLGVIRSVTFTPREWRALADKQPNNS